jgi:hypothetical protein
MMMIVSAIDVFLKVTKQETLTKNEHIHNIQN